MPNEPAPLPSSRHDSLMRSSRSVVSNDKSHALSGAACPVRLMRQRRESPCGP
jgi:hypothetical protein